MSTRIRRATLDDAPALARLHRACFAEKWDAASMEATLSHPATQGFVAHDAAANELQAFILIQTFADEAEILTLGTAPAARRNGLAKALLFHAAGEAGDCGARTIFLEVNETNAGALALYEGAGFTIVGRRDSYYREGPSYSEGTGAADALRLSAVLPF